MISFITNKIAQSRTTALQNQNQEGRINTATKPYANDCFVRSAKPKTEAQPSFGAALKISEYDDRLLIRIEKILDKIDEKTDNSPEALGLDFDTEAVAEHGREIAGHYVDLAKTYLALGENNGLCRNHAFNAALDAVEAHPDHPEANYLCASLEGVPQDADAYIQKALEGEPNNTQYLLLGAEIAEECEDKKTAFNRINKAVKLEPKNYEVLIKKGFLHSNFKQPKKALIAFETAIGIVPQRFDAHCGKAEILMKQGDFENSITHFRKALESNPTTEAVGMIHTNIAMCQFQQKNYPEAIKSYSLALEADPDADLFIDRGCCHLYVGNTQAAINDAKMATKSGDDSAAPIAIEVVALQIEGKTKEAKDLLKRAEDAYPEENFRAEIRAIKKNKAAYEAKLAGEKSD